MEPRKIPVFVVSRTYDSFHHSKLILVHFICIMMSFKKDANARKLQGNSDPRIVDGIKLLVVFFW